MCNQTPEMTERTPGTETEISFDHTDTESDYDSDEDSTESSLGSAGELLLQETASTIAARDLLPRNYANQVIISSQAAHMLQRNLHGSGGNLLQAMRNVTVQGNVSNNDFPRRFSDPSLRSSMFAIQTTSAQEEPMYRRAQTSNDGPVKPFDFYQSVLRQHGIDANPISYLDVPEGFFTPWSKENTDSYTMEIVTAVRRNELETLQAIHQRNGEMTLRCCNRFGESLMHMICRKGNTEILRYMLEYQVPVRVVCDSGRTILHDGCWNSTNFDCMKLVLEACPDLLLIRDNRGHTPLEYVPRDVWLDWVEFLEDHADLILPRELHGILA